MNKKMIRKNRFTLVELMVSMAVFSILLLVSVQIFASSRKLWLGSEQKNRIYADARCAMEFITARLQTQAYTDGMPFGIEQQSKEEENNKNSTMFFPTAMPMNRKKGDADRDKISMRFIGFLLTKDGILRMQIYSDEGKTRSFQKNIPPFSNPKAAWKDIKDKTVGKDASKEEYNQIDLMDNVYKFELIPYYREDGVNSTVTEVSQNIIISPPYRLDIKLTVADSPENFKKWQDLKTGTEEEKKEKETFEKENCYQFTRSVLLNYRGKVLKEYEYE